MSLLFNSKRKKEHLDIIRSKDTSFNIKTGFEDISFIPKTLPELSFDEINTSTTLLGHKFDAPILISSMTGGTEEALKINQTLARAAEKYNIPFALGSQKAMILRPELSHTYETKDVAPKAKCIGNIGIDYLLSSEFKIDDLRKACKKINAFALYIHINPLQEIVQPEGTKNFKGAKKKIAEVCSELELPILIKEVGNGINPETAKELESYGVKVIDIAGSGGTSWSLVESYRGAKIGESFRDWGFPTALNLISIRDKVSIPVIASGGIRTGQEIAKSIALGAEFVGIAKPFAIAAFKGERYLYELIEDLILELKITMLLVGAKNISDLKKTKLLIGKELGELVEQLKD